MSAICLWLSLSATAAEEPTVIVLERPSHTGEFADRGLQRRLRARLGPDLHIAPGEDVPQPGRQMPDIATPPDLQQTAPSDAALARAMAEAAHIGNHHDDAQEPEDWLLTAHRLREHLSAVWFIDRAEARAPVFALYAQIGRAADLSGNPAPPFFELVEGEPTNYYWHLAATLAAEEPGLLDLLKSESTRTEIAHLAEGVGDLDPVLLDFELGPWSPREFASTYVLYINGLEALITDDKKGVMRVPPGRTDVVLMREGGPALADRVDFDTRPGRYGVRKTAQRHAEVLAETLRRTEECTAALDRAHANDLAIYAQLSARPLWVAVAGEPLSSGLWRWDGTTLQRSSKECTSES